jgi:RNA polymerase sigma factor for flagellar operon FliA
MTRQMEMETGMAPSDEEVSAALNVGVDEIRTLRGEMLVPVQVQQNGSDDDQALNLDTLPDQHAFDPMVEAQRSDLREFLVRGLNSAERQVVILYYYENMSLREIGETLALCESRVSQIHQSVIRRLRERMHRIGGTTVEE